MSSVPSQKNCLTSRFHVASSCPLIENRWCENAVRTKKWHTRWQLSVSLMLKFHVQKVVATALSAHLLMAYFDNVLPMKQRYLQSFACRAIHSLCPAVAEGKTHDTAGFQGSDKTSHPLGQLLLYQHSPASWVPCNNSVRMIRQYWFRSVNSNFPLDKSLLDNAINNYRHVQAGGGWGWGSLPCGKVRVLVVLLSGVNHRFWSCLGCSGQNAAICSYQGIF